MKNILKNIIGKITKLLIKKYSPYIIAITGSVGKTSTKNTIVAVLKNFNVLGSGGNLNTEFGAPLVFFKQKKLSGKLDWIKIIFRGLFLLIFRDKNYPKIVVVEMAADKPGDIEYLSNIISPDIAVVTAIGDVPVHIEFYKDAKHIAREKGKLVSACKNTAILCADDPLVSSMQGGRNKLLFGFNSNSDIRIDNFKNKLEGVSFDINYNGENLPFILKGCVGKPCVYSFATAFAVAVSLSVKPKDILTEGVNPSNGRLSILKGEKGSVVIDGSYNAAPNSVIAALECLQDLPGKRKIAVLGDMLELGDYSQTEHIKVGEKAASFCDYVVFVGKFGESTKNNLLQKGVDKDKLFSYILSEEAILMLRDLVLKDDLILVKGSQKIRTEKIVYALMKEKEKAEQLLVRQTKPWHE